MAKKTQQDRCSGIIEEYYNLLRKFKDLHQRIEERLDTNIMLIEKAEDLFDDESTDEDYLCEPEEKSLDGILSEEADYEEEEDDSELYSQALETHLRAESFVINYSYQEAINQYEATRETLGQINQRTPEMEELFIEDLFKIGYCHEMLEDYKSAFYAYSGAVRMAQDSSEIRKSARNDLLGKAYYQLANIFFISGVRDPKNLELSHDYIGRGLSLKLNPELKGKFMEFKHEVSYLLECVNDANRIGMLNV